MKKLAQKFTSLVVAFMMGVGLIAPAINATPTYATAITPASAVDAAPISTTTFGASAAILKGCAGADKGHGESIKCIVRLVIDILSILIGIAGVIGIVIVGIQYLTAGGNEEQTRKAKRRLFEIVIGLVAYAAAYALLAWLLPSFDPKSNDTSYINTTISLITPLIGA